ncbi:MAG: hypothetical protein JSR65_13040 [Proteobacteria bacterium]|nr:hypothetical protein [Pseudomonadota bacterium]
MPRLRIRHIERKLALTANEKSISHRKNLAEVHAGQPAKQQNRRQAFRDFGWPRRSHGWNIGAHIRVAIRFEHELHRTEADQIAKTQDRFLTHRTRVHMRACLRRANGQLDAAVAQFQYKMMRRNAIAANHNGIVLCRADPDLADADQGVLLFLAREANTHA